MYSKSLSPSKKSKIRKVHFFLGHPNVHPKFLDIYLGIVAVSFLRQKPARTMGDTLTAYVPREVTQVSRMTNVHPKFLEKSPR